MSVYNHAKVSRELEVPADVYATKSHGFPSLREPFTVLIPPMNKDLFQAYKKSG